jgi:hypothetical protein
MNDLIGPSSSTYAQFDVHKCDDNCRVICEDCTKYFCTLDSEEFAAIPDDFYDPNFIYICEKCRLRKY